MGKDLGKTSPCGACDVANNVGRADVGTGRDTGGFAAESIRRRRRASGKERFPDASRLPIAADCGGSNGSRVRPRKTELRNLAREPGMETGVRRLPPGTGKRSKIERRLFSFIGRNRRGRPPADIATIVGLIAATGAGSGLKVRCSLDETFCPEGVKAAKEDVKALDIRRSEFRREWNCTLPPRPKPGSEAFGSKQANEAVNN